MKKRLAVLLAMSVILSCSACKKKESDSSDSDSSSSSVSESSSVTSDTTTESAQETLAYKYQKYATMTPEEIVAEMTLEEKAAQMVQPAVYCVTEDQMRKNDYGSILSKEYTISAENWRTLVDGYQQAAIESESGIPYIYGQDDVHGVNYCLNAVYFPHNIGLGAANDEELMYQVGLITADEAKQCHMLWNFAPCVAQSNDPRWGRNYESYGSDLTAITKLSTAYTRGLVDGGVVACAKHFFADGNVVYGTGEKSDCDRIIDRGDAQLSPENIEALLAVYQAQIDAGVQTIMISHSSLNGVKMHENGEYIMKLKNEMGFTGFIVSDWDSVQNTTSESYKEQVITSINAGIDMLMEVERFEEARQIIIEAVKSGEISEERVNDAVTRIIRVKKDEGLFDDPLCEKMTTVQKETGSMEYRAVAEKLVEESLVLLKNEKETLPLREGTKVYITGPAADNGQAQCGGWTIDWNGSPNEEIAGVTTILEAFERYAADYGIEVITDSAKASEADVVLLCVGEQSYAEWNGDAEDMQLCGKLGLDGNREAIDAAEKLGKPTVTLIVAGRQVILDQKDYKNWDSVVMCYLPGSEGKGISDVLCGCADFTGKLPEPWYGSVEKILTEDVVFERGYGLSYGDGFAAKKEPEAIPDEGTEQETDTNEAFAIDSAAKDTNYVRGVFNNGVYTNEFAGITLNISDSCSQASDTSLKQVADMNANPQNYGATVSQEYQEVWTSVIWDNLFSDSKYDVYINFVNTKMAMPENPDCSVDEFLDKVRVSEGLSADCPYDERTTVTLGGVEYTREGYYVPFAKIHCVYYVTRIDENLMSFFAVQVKDGTDDLYFFESWFA